MMNTKITSRFFLFTVMLAVMLMGAAAVAQERSGEGKYDPLAKVEAYTPDRYGALNINNVVTWMREDGLCFSPNNNNCSFFPRGTTNSIYKEGLLWMAKFYSDEAKTVEAPFGQLLRMSGQTYGNGCREGWVEGLGADAIAVPKDDPVARIFRIRRDYTEMPESDIIRDVAESFEKVAEDVVQQEIDIVMDDYEYSWNNWPVQHGAPFVDRDGDGVYTPPPPYNTRDASGEPLDPASAGYFGAKQLMEQGYDEPGLVGKDVNSPAGQVVFAIFNDLNEQVNYANWDCYSTGFEIQETLWGYKRSDPLGNVYFRKYKISNKGGVTTTVDAATGVESPGAFWADSLYVCQWSDPDMGTYTNDLLGCDSLLSIGFVWNGTAVDPQYIEFNLPPPCIGYDFLQGPIMYTGDPADRAIFDFKYVDGAVNMGMTGFSYFSAGSMYSDPGGSYNVRIEKYWKLMQSQVPLLGPPQFFPHPPGVTPGRYPFAGDPTTGQGHLDGQGTPYSFVPGDRRLLIVTGPFNMAPGDVQEVVVANVSGMGTDRYSSVAVMKFNDRFAQNTYDNLFQVTAPPEAPIVNSLWLDNEILLEWGSNITRIEEIESGVRDPGAFTFEGYNVYQLPQDNSLKADAILIGTFDVVNQRLMIWDEQFDPVTGQILRKPVAFGNDGGIKRSFQLDKDYVLDVDKLNNGSEYYLAVTAYIATDDPEFLPQTMESEWRAITVVPQVPFGTEYTAEYEDEIAVTHAAGISQGEVSAVVVDPSALTGDDYRVTFSEVDGVWTWNLTDVTTGEVLVQNGTNLSGNTDYPIAHGFKVVVGNPGVDWGDWAVWANASGPIDPDPASADWKGFPVTGSPTSGQQVGPAKWMLSGSNLVGDVLEVRDSFVWFSNEVMRGENMDRAWPLDWEMRFTEAGGYAVDKLQGDRVLEVPFELWQVGNLTPDDPSDDYRCIPYIFDIDSNDVFQIVEGTDSGISGGSNDPYMDMFSWYMPADASVGTAGYDAFADAVEANSMVLSDADAAALVGGEIMHQAQLQTWNLGSAPPYGQVVPETGTIFRFMTTKMVAGDDVFTFSTTAPVSNDSLALASAKTVGVFPNPYYAQNALESNLIARFITFNNLPPVATIRLFNLAGHLVKTIEKDDVSQFARWDLLNQARLPVASGIYIAHVNMPDLKKEKILKIVVIQEAEILPVY